MIKISKVTSLERVLNLRNGYIRGLDEPIDGYWETVVVGNSECYEIFHNDDIVGYCSIKDNKSLVQLQVYKEYYTYSDDIMRYLINTQAIQDAYVSTKEPEYLSLCIDFHKEMKVDTYLFTDNGSIQIKLKNLNFRLALVSDIEHIRAECDGAFDGYYEGLIDKKQLFVLYENDIFIGIGELRVMESNEKYADIGVIISSKHRRRGMGTAILSNLKNRCYERGLKPLACCDIKNIASRKTLEKSGFTCNHRIVKVDFKRE